MAPIGSSKPGASSRNKPEPSKLAEKSALSVVATRIKNAKELRRAYIELNQSPDGADPDPLTVPKCVECAHCGWPVFPRESKIATKKTFARAGIVRGNKKEEDAKRRAAGGGQDEEEGSVDSRDTVERMADDLEELRDENEQLQEKNQTLEAQNEMLTKELEETKEALDAAMERIDFLEEAELRWRDKLSQARLEIERLKQVLERSGMVSADRECGLVKTLLELRDLREKFALYVRRRNFMLREWEARLEAREKEDYKGITLRMWRAKAINQKLTRELEDLEVKRQREVREFQTQLAVEREQVQNLRTERERLVARLKEAAHRLLRRSLSSDAWPNFKSHVFRALKGEHPVNLLENALEFCQAELEKANNELEAMTEKAEGLEEERDELRRDRDRLAEKAQSIADELEFLKGQIGGSLEEMEARKQAMEAEKKKFLDEIEHWKRKLADAEEAFSEERESLETQIRMLESRLSVAEAAAENAANGGPGGEDDDPSRVVPKGQGVVCVSCLKQLVHRSVKPLPPLGALCVTDEKLEKAKQLFFQKTLAGAADPDDELHDHAFKAQKDPYGLARLTLLPPGGAIMKPTTLTSPTAGCLRPTTGLPSLRKKGGLTCSATELRSTMKEFRPRNFR